MKFMLQTAEEAKFLLLTEFLLAIKKKSVIMYNR